MNFNRKYVNPNKAKWIVDIKKKKKNSLSFQNEHTKKILFFLPVVGQKNTSSIRVGLGSTFLNEM